jgi:DNA-binding NarL/FixJ family response regulator
MPHAEPQQSPRRREIAILLTEGRTLDEIARMLTITPAAVAADVECILQRLDRASRAEVMSWGSERAAATNAPRMHLWVVTSESRAA